MDVDVTMLADIRRPRAEVAAFASDPRNAPRWYANIRSVDVLTDGPVGVGSRMRFVATFLSFRCASHPSQRVRTHPITGYPVIAT